MSKRKTQEEFVNDVFNLFGDEYRVLGNYVNTMTKIKMEHITCGHDYEATPNRILSGNRCPNCFRSFKKTTEQFKQEVFNLVGDEYKVLGEYINAKTKIKMEHSKCSHVYEIKPSMFLVGNRCMECSGKKKYTTETFKTKMFGIVGNEYTMKDKYTNASTKIKIIHNICGNSYPVKPNSFLNGDRCPFCSSKQSKGEKLIDKLLSVNNINFDREYTFDDCRNVGHLRFDFAILDIENKIECLIEFDGIQHYKPTFGEEIFELTKNNDAIKDKYCEEKDIKLIRIPYFEFERIEEILSNLIKAS